MNILYRIYQYLIGYPIFAIATVITTVANVVGCAIGNAKWWGDYPDRWWGKTAIRAMLIPVEVEGRENIDDDQSYVFVANHQGFFDIFLVFGYLNKSIKWMMKWQIAHWPFIGISAVKSGQILVDKRSRAALRNTYDHARRTLQGGTSVVIFPEGARTHDGRIAKFNRGGFALADELQLPVVPLTINGSFDVMPRSGSHPECARGEKKSSQLVRRFPLKLTIHKPIYPTSQGADNQQRLMEESYKVIHSALAEEYK